MQAKTVSERELVILSVEDLCRQAGFGHPGNMVQRDLEYVSDSIASKTGVNISLSTLKRLINGEFARLPQIATLNAIAAFLDCANWHEYKIKKTLEIRNDQPEVAETMDSKPREYSRSRKAFFRYSIVGILVVFISLSLVAILTFQKPGPRNIDKAEFSARKTTSNELPNSVVFNYNIDKVIADSFFIQQSWDKNRRVRIYKNNYTLTDIYYEPGYHTARLIANDQIIKTIDVSIPTDRWLFYSKEKTAKPQPVYINAGSGVHNGSLQLLPEQITNSQIDLQKKNEYISVYFPGKIESNSDNFILKFRIRVNLVNTDPCPYFMTEVFCQRNFMYFISTRKGCASEMIAQFGENLQSGKKHDLSALANEPNRWQDVELLLKDKKVTIRMNDQLVFSTSYQQAAGLITGLGFMSNNLVEVDFVELKTLDGKDVYTSDFN